MNITREQARAIVSAAIEELGKVEDDHPRIADLISNVKNMLDHSLKLDGPIYEEWRAVKYFGGIITNASEILGASDMNRLSADHVDVIVATQRDLAQFAAEIFGRPFAGEPTRVLRRSDFTPEELAS